MGRLFFFGFLSTIFMFADNYGVIQSIDAKNKMIAVNQTNIKVLPYTKIEEEKCTGGWDAPKKFADLKVGQVVEIEFLGAENNMLVAEDIEIQCANRSY